MSAENPKKHDIPLDILENISTAMEANKRWYKDHDHNSFNEAIQKWYAILSWHNFKNHCRVLK